MRTQTRPAEAPEPVIGSRAGSHLAVADIGSTGARFELVELRPDGFRRVLRDKVRLELGRKVFAGGRIEEAAQDRLAELLRHWQGICDQTGAKARFVGTSAFREANNSREVVDALHATTGVRLELLSGEREALLIAQGALPNAGRTTPVVVIDVGGGSTEVAVGRDGLCLEAISLPLGSARFGAAAHGLMTTGADAVRRLVERLLPRDHGQGASMALITSGTTRALLRWAAPASSGCLTASELPARLAVLDAMGSAGRASIFGDREHKVIPAGLILHQIIDRLGVPVLVPCKQGLRHGLLLELAYGAAGARA